MAVVYHESHIEERLFSKLLFGGKPESNKPLSSQLILFGSRENTKPKPNHYSNTNRPMNNNLARQNELTESNFISLMIKHLGVEEAPKKTEEKAVPPLPARTNNRAILNEMGLPQSFLVDNNIDEYFFDSLNPNLQAEIIMLTMGEVPEEAEEIQFVNPFFN